MSTSAKQLFLRGVRDRLVDVVTVSQMDAILSAISDEADGYTIEYNPIDDGQVSLTLVDEFLRAKSIEGKSPNTLKQYGYILRQAFTAVGVPITKITVYHLRSYLMREKDRGILDASLNGTRSVLCSFYGWLHIEGLIDRDPTANLGPIKCPKVMRLPFSDVEVERLKTACTSTRQKAIVCFLLATGCRVSELVSTRRDAVDLVAMDCRVVGKGNKERRVYLDTVTVMYLKQYLATRTDDQPWLFVSGTLEQPYTPAGIQAMLRNLGKRLGIPDVHPHRFRRTLATNLIRRGMPIQEVAFILGHDKIDTTMRYVYIEDSQVRTAYKQYSR